MAQSAGGFGVLQAAQSSTTVPSATPTGKSSLPPLVGAGARMGRRHRKGRLSKQALAQGCRGACRRRRAVAASHSDEPPTSTARSGSGRALDRHATQSVADLEQVTQQILREAVGIGNLEQVRTAHARCRECIRPIAPPGSAGRRCSRQQVRRAPPAGSRNLATSGWTMPNRPESMAVWNVRHRADSRRQPGARGRWLRPGSIRPSAGRPSEVPRSSRDRTPRAWGRTDTRLPSPRLGWHRPSTVRFRATPWRPGAGTEVGRLAEADLELERAMAGRAAALDGVGGGLPWIDPGGVHRHRTVVAPPSARHRGGRACAPQVVDREVEPAAAAEKRRRRRSGCAAHAGRGRSPPTRPPDRRATCRAREGPRCRRAGVHDARRRHWEIAPHLAPAARAVAVLGAQRTPRCVRSWCRTEVQPAGAIGTRNMGVDAGPGSVRSWLSDGGSGRQTLRRRDVEWYAEQQIERKVTPSDRANARPGLAVGRASRIAAGTAM